jgi:hypothetical protein
VLLVVLAERQHGNVGLRLGDAFGRERTLHTHDGAPYQGRCQEHGELVDRGAVRRTDGRHLDQRPFEQLDALVLEGAEFDELIVLTPEQRADMRLFVLDHDANLPRIARMLFRRPTGAQVARLLYVLAPHAVTASFATSHGPANGAR